MVWCNALMRYYSGVNLENIPKMTLWQFVQSVRNIGWLESQGKKSVADARKAFGQRPGEVPSRRDIRALARQINPNLKIPKE